MSEDSAAPLPPLSPPSVSPFRSDCLKGKVAVITGGGSGIGYEISKQLLHHGCRAIILCGRRESFLRQASESLSAFKCHYQVCDVRQPQDCARVVKFVQKHFGQLDILVNAAAGNFLARAQDLRPKGFRTVMEIDTIGTYQMCHASFPLLHESQEGVIVNISATLQYGATWYQSHASAAKAAIDSLTRSLALEWGSSSRIRVMGIAPGPIANTPGTTKLAPGASAEEMEEAVAEAVPLGRMGTAFDIAMAAVFLCCNASASYVTGDVLVVDGGHWLYKPPVIPPEMVAELSKAVEQKSRALAPTTTQSKL